MTGTWENYKSCESCGDPTTRQSIGRFGVPLVDVDIHAPEFPPRMEWLNVAFLRMDRLLGRHAVLVEFWDFARINSLHTLPYLKAWHERYADAGLQVIAVHSPGYSFGREREAAARAVERLEVSYPVLLDP